MAPVRHITILNAILLLVVVWLMSKGVRILRHRRKATQLKGPPSKSLIFGNSRFLSGQKDVAHLYEEWAEQYGDVFCIPTTLGGTTMIACDPKAIQHLYSK